MRTRVLLQHLLTLGVLLAASGALTSRYVFAPEEYSIYSEIFDGWYEKDNQDCLLVRDHTAVHREGDSFRQELSFLASEIPGIKEETINDFLSKNIKAYPLSEFSSQKQKYKIISQDELDSLFESKQPRWSRFRQKYPEAKGIFTLSRVGFSPDRTQALVYVANQWDSYSGSGNYIFLVKTGQGIWKIQKIIKGWHSWNREDIEL
ncbi:MAG: hypothetical protein PHU64_07650 [Candidatus Omnitrophica bacterium]|nr:hypothetical protein [Candidatus Omnitrophota bacterium]